MRTRLLLVKHQRILILLIILCVFPFSKSILFAQILLKSGFEGSDPFAGFINRQSCCPYSVTASKEHPHEGLQSFRSEVRAGDPPVSKGYRAELTTPAIRDTGDMWYGWSMYFETPVSDGYWTGGFGGHFVQWHPANSTGSASLSLWGSDGIWDVATNPEGDGSAVHHAPGKLKIVGNKWHDVVFHVNWSTGVVQFWLNDSLLVDLKNIDYAAGPGQYFKFGMNKWGNGPGPTHDWVIYYDNLKIGRNVSYRDVAPGN
jgi:hypothetical protein